MNFNVTSTFAFLDDLYLHRNSLFKFLTVGDDTHATIRLSGYLLKLFEC